MWTLGAWFVVGMTAIAAYLTLALVGVSMWFIWPLPVITGVSIYACLHDGHLRR